MHIFHYFSGFLTAAVVMWQGVAGVPAMTYAQVVPIHAERMATADDLAPPSKMPPPSKVLPPVFKKDMRIATTTPPKTLDRRSQ